MLGRCQLFVRPTLICLGLNACLSPQLVAQELEPRSYTNLPTGQHFLAAGYANSSGEVSPSPGSPVEDAKLDIDAYILGYATTFGLLGSSAKFDTAISRTCFSGSARLNGDQVSVDRCGYTDPTVRLTWNFYGAPAMDIASYAKWQQGLWLVPVCKLRHRLGVIKQINCSIVVPIGGYIDPALACRINWVAGTMT